MTNGINATQVTFAKAHNAAVSSYIILDTKFRYYKILMANIVADKGL